MGAIVSLCPDCRTMQSGSIRQVRQNPKNLPFVSRSRCGSQCQNPAPENLRGRGDYRGVGATYVMGRKAPMTRSSDVPARLCADAQAVGGPKRQPASGGGC
jgi:hypothetical protein